MKKTYIALIVAAMLIISFLYFSETRKSLFPERLGDMTLTRYETGDIAAHQISSMYGLKDIPLAKGYSAVYRGRNGTMWIWIAEAPDHNIANDAFNSMNSMLGASEGHEKHEFSGDVGQVESQNHIDDKMGNFTSPVKVEMLDLLKPEVYMMEANNASNYYYLKMDYRMGSVYWIIFNNPDAGYQKAMVKQAIMDIQVEQ